MPDDLPRRPSPLGDMIQRWPLGLPATALLVGGLTLLLVVSVFLLRPDASTETQARQSGLSIAVYEPPPPAVDPGERIDVLQGAANGFEGLPDRPEPEPPQVGDWLAGAQVETYTPPMPPPAPAAQCIVTPPVEPRRYRSDGRQDCTYARSRAEAMVCRDGRLAQIDDDLARAFSRAMERADDPRRVMRDQQRWERAREVAAIDGPEAVEHVYRQRLAELDF